MLTLLSSRGAIIIAGMQIADGHCREGGLIHNAIEPRIWKTGQKLAYLGPWVNNMKRTDLEAKTVLKARGCPIWADVTAVTTGREAPVLNTPMWR